MLININMATIEEDIAYVNRVGENMAQGLHAPHPLFDRPYWHTKARVNQQKASDAETSAQRQYHQNTADAASSEASSCNRQLCGWLVRMAPW